MRWDTSQDEQLAEGIDDVGCATRMARLSSAELVDDAQHSECLSVVGAVSDEVIGADMIRSFPAANGCTSRR